MQMGRWFGYRDDYADLCRIYMSEKSRKWYTYVHDVTDELYLSFIRMAQLKKTPLDFGLRVRRDTSGLLVTARNKSQAAQLVEINADLQNALIETHTLDLSANHQNTELTKKFLSSFTFTKSERMNAMLARANPTEIIDFLVNFRYSERLNPYWSPLELTGIVAGLRDSGFDRWDIAVFGGESELVIDCMSHKLHMERRLCEFDDTCTSLHINPGRARVAGRGAERAGMSEAEIQAAEAKCSQTIKSKNIADLYYRAERTTPLLMVHFIEPMSKVDGDAKCFGKDARPIVVAIGLSIPPCDELARKPVTYMTNAIWQEFKTEVVTSEYDED